MSYTWVGQSSGGVWSNANNWAPAGNPTASDDVIISKLTDIITVDVPVTCQSINISGSTTLNLSAALTVDSAFTIDGNLTFTGTGSATIGGYTTFGFNVALIVGANNTLNFPSGSSVVIGGNNLNSITNNGVMNFIGSTFNYGFQTVFTNNGTVNLTSSTFYGSGNSFTFSNAGLLTLSSASTFTIFDYSVLANTGTISSNGSAFTISGSSFPASQLTNTGIFKATSTTFILSGSNSNIQNTGSFTSNLCTYNISNSGTILNRIYNASTFIDHGSTFTINDYSNYIQNSGSLANMHLRGSNITAIGTSDGIYNSGTLTADSASTITLNQYVCFINNSGTFYAGTSGSACVINLSAQSSAINNTSAFYLGSNSIIYPSALSATVTNTSPGVFTLQSDAKGSAAIGPLNTSIATGQPAIFIGNFNVERYFQGGTAYDNAKKRYLERSYRIISSPVNTGIQVNGNYISDLSYIVGATAGLTTTANSTTNAFVTGATGGNTSSGNPSLFLFRENKAPSTSVTGGNFIGITNITQASALGTTDPGSWTVPTGNAVLFFFRGNATNYKAKTTSPYVAPENVTLTSIGNLNQQQITVANWFTPTAATLSYTAATAANTPVRGFNMVGNPYACSIDWNTAFAGTGITRTNINPTIYVFNPVTNQYDSYITTSATTGIGTGSATNIIASGQGFFVRATVAAASSLVFNETAKAPTSQPTGGNLLMGIPAGQDVVQQSLRLKMVKDSLNYDDIMIMFNSTASAKYDHNEDAQYLPGVNALEGLASLSSDSVKLSINSLPLTTKAPQVIKLNVVAESSGAYSLQRAELKAIPQIFQVWLMDNFKKDSLDLRKNSTYPFNIDLTDSTTFGSNRFTILIRLDPTQGLQLLDFAAIKAPNGAEIIWKTQNEQNYTHFTVERSTDNGKTFDVLGSVLSSGLGTYSLMDKDPLIGTDQYRLKLEDLNGALSYSNVVSLIYSDLNTNVNNNSISVYPNPSSTVINLAITNTTAAASTSNLPVTQSNTLAQSQASIQANENQNYGIKIINSSGSVIRTVKSTQSNVQVGVSDLLPGTYILQVVNNKDKSVVGQNTFVKL